MSKKVLCAVCGFCLSVLFLTSVLGVEDVIVNMSPHRIILNAKSKGALQDVQAIIPMYLPAGCQIADFEVTLKLDDAPVAEAFDLRYCFVDDNLLVSFDRQEIQSYCIENTLTGEGIKATVAGWLVAVKTDGSEVRIDFTGDDLVDILNPGAS